MKDRFIIYSLLIFLCFGCTTQKSLTYFRNIDDPSELKDLNKYFSKRGDVRIASGDALVILVSALDPVAVAPFNMPAVMHSSPNSDVIQSTPLMMHYVVDTAGYINFPVLGKVMMAGRTKAEAVSYLEGRISASVKDPIVTINFLNFNVDVIGEVKSPGRYKMNDERVTIIDAIARAGDLTPYGKRNTVKVIRDNNGQLECGVVNLNSSKIFSSPYYYLQQNDIVFVEPNGVRAMNSQNIGTYLSMLTTLASMATVVISVVSLSK